MFVRNDEGWSETNAPSPKKKIAEIKKDLAAVRKLIEALDEVPRRALAPAFRRWPRQNGTAAEFYGQCLMAERMLTERLNQETQALDQG